MSVFWDLLIFVGLYSSCCYLYENLKSPFKLVRYWLQKSKEGINLRQRYGNWAAITGSTDGIGKAYACELASRGINIVLISRSQQKLRDVAKEIESNYAVETQIIVADFTQGVDIYKHIEKELGDLPIGILVNNIGTSTSLPGELAAFSPIELYKVLQTNTVPVTILSSLFINRMRRSHIRGIIVNISSGLELLSMPGSGALYAATKAFVQSLSKSLQYEASSSGIEIQHVSPGFVVTKINSYSSFIMRGNFAMPTASSYARSAVATMGITNTTGGYFFHGLTAAIAKLVPYDARTWLSAKLNYIFIDKYHF